MYNPIYSEFTFELPLFLLNLTEGVLSSKDILTIRIFRKISKVFMKFVTRDGSDGYTGIFAS